MKIDFNQEVIACLEEMEWGRRREVVEEQEEELVEEVEGPAEWEEAGLEQVPGVTASVPVAGQR